MMRVMTAIVVGLFIGTGAAAAETAPPDSWSHEVLGKLAAQEYRFSWHDGVLTAPNRAHGLRMRVRADGFSIESRTEGEAAFLLDLRLAMLGRGDTLAPVEAGLVVGDEAKAELRRPQATEWLQNRTEGVEHGLSIARPPAGSEGRLVIAFELGGNTLAYPEGSDGRSILFRDGRGAAVVRYGGLVVKDARGEALPAAMTVAPGILRIEVDDHGAVYPVTVDPLATSPQWDVSINQAGARFGSSLAAAGDVNGDGYSDVMVAAYAYDDGETDEGKVFLYYGGPSGLSTTPAWTAQSNQAGGGMGSSCAAAGDVNDDGYGDVIIGAYTYDHGATDAGAAFIWLGGPSGLGADGTPANAAWVVYGTQTNEHLGQRVARAGDVNKDGYDDVIVGAPGYSGAAKGDGAAFVYHGSATVPSTVPNWTGTVSGVHAGAGFGSAVATAGDVNGDGYDDVIVGAPNYAATLTDEGAIFVYRGSAGGLSTSVSFQANGGEAGALLGYSVAGVGDENGDGYADFAAGAPHADGNGFTDCGKIELWVGGSGTPLDLWQFFAPQNSAQLGFSLSAAGDVNGDGFADILAGSDVWDGTFTDEGRAWLFLGKSGTPSSTPSWTVDGGQAFAYAGDAVSGAGDVNGDGYSDVIVGVYGWDDAQADSGDARVYLGSAAGLKTTPDTTVTPGQAFAQFGYAVAGAGDVNGDGFSDVIVGAWQYDDGESNEGAAFIYHGGPNGLSTVPNATIEGNQAGGFFGWNVAAAGDVNGDGYGDVIVGAYAFDNPGAESGAAWVYRGSASGITGTRWDVTPVQTGAEAGWSVAGAGDVNGDGYADVLIGAIHWDVATTDEGADFIAYGGSSGPGAPQRFGASLGTSFMRMGQLVASAGDVNGDGYSDVLVGMETWDGFGGGDHGKVYLFMGGAAGISANPASWSPEGSVPQQHFGSAAASAGDVNGDGYGDIVIGASGYANGQTGEGRALVYLGGPGGPSPSPSWTFETDQASAALGNGQTSVSSAGDVNGDGYSDVIVGASGWTEGGNTGAGKAWLFLGSASGLSPVPAWSVVGATFGNSLGYSVACAGDVNADGYADVVIGERYNGDGGNTQQGKAYVYYGNGGTGGKSHNTRQFNGSFTRNVAPLGAVDGDGTLLASHTSWYAWGFDGGHPEVEVKPLTSAFNGTGTVVGFGSSAHGSVNATTSVFGLSPLTAYKWRVRYRDLRSPYIPRTPWFDIADTSRTLTDFRTPCHPSTWYQDSDGDGHGNPNVTVSSCLIVIGYSLVGDDCDDTNAAKYPGNTEICDGLDNNCDGIVDNAAPPSGASQITVAKSGFTAILSWSPIAGASSYDAVRGSLSTLRAFTGNYTAALNACLANDTAGPTVSDTSVPPVGDAAWYLLRGVNCGGGGSYDEGVPSQAAPRDAEIAASSSACP
ncbi:MAG TPA: FG-GAP-like repeat-containing protein [Candidatus Polarisedimenticolaceae bacterium]|nr:FG-GAP-like repeat-containing protein [Candidatus Polarisedimenticolaceae bacterium]